MSKRISLLVALVSLLAVTGTALAHPPQPQHTDPFWQAVYWNNMSLSGQPALTRSEANLDHDWGTGAPAPTVNADGFSARWTRYIDVSAGTYRFTVTSDDGVRVWVDGGLIIEEWNDHPATAFTAEVDLTDGHHLVRVEYYENMIDAVARLTWKPVTAGSGGWLAQFFNNKTLSGPAAFSQTYSEVNFDWGRGSPAPGQVNPDVFSARFTRTADLPAGHYHFEVTADDGVRLWVNDHLLIDAWKDQPATTYTDDIFLPGGSTAVRVEYYENFQVAVARVSWTRTGSGTPTPTPGAVLVDDTDPGFVRGGRAAGWRVQSEGHGDHLTWTWNSDRGRPGYNWGRWHPKLKPGRYEVLVYVPERYTTTSQARYWISHAGGRTLRIVDQSRNGSRWVSLGTYRFQGTQSDWVSLADVTFEPRRSRLVAWDAVKWEPR